MQLAVGSIYQKVETRDSDSLERVDWWNCLATGRTRDKWTIVARYGYLVCACSEARLGLITSPLGASETMQRWDEREDDAATSPSPFALQKQ